MVHHHVHYTNSIDGGSNMKLIAEQIQEVEYILEEKEDGKEMKIVESLCRRP